MNFLINTNIWDDSEEISSAHLRYFRFVRENSEIFPASVVEFVEAEWHWDAQDPRCPHDAWLENLEIIERSNQENGQDRFLEIRIILLGAQHDGKIEISYKGVIDYDLKKVSSDKKGHGDWLIDEFSISENGNCVHTIEFANATLWEIHFSDFSYEWHPFSA